MAITLADFNKIWSSASPLSPYTFSDDNYNEGWNFIGQIPPSRQMWDFLQKNNDEKMQYLANNYLPLSGGTMSGNITFSQSLPSITCSTDSQRISYCGATSDTKGATLYMYGKDYQSANAGAFLLRAKDGTNAKDLLAKPDGTLTWDGKLLSAPNGRILTAGGTVEAVQNTTVDVTSVTLDKSISGRWMVLSNCGISVNSNVTFACSLNAGSANATVRFNGTNGGGVTNACYFGISSDTVVKLTAYSPTSTALNFIGTMWAIPLM